MSGSGIQTTCRLKGKILQFRRQHTWNRTQHRELFKKMVTVICMDMLGQQATCGKTGRGGKSVDVLTF